MRLALIFTFIWHFFVAKGLKINGFLSNDSRIVNICDDYGQIEHGYTTIVESEITGQTLHIECNDGYDLQGPPKLLCIQGQWEHVRPHCIARCPPPPFVKNGALEIEGLKDPRGRFGKGAVAAYTCGGGYELVPADSQLRVCEKGIWTGAVATCVLVGGCKLPKSIENGYFVQEKMGEMDAYGIGQRLHFSCNSGYTLVGPSVQQCVNDGMWSPKSPPTCVPQISESMDDYPCRPTPAVAHSQTTVLHGYQTATVAIPGTEVEIKCIPRYRNNMSPCQSARLRCSGGIWIGGVLPSCVPAKECASPPNVFYATAFVLNPRLSDVHRNLKYPINSQISYQCRPGFELQGNYVLTCESGGCWNPSAPPVCKNNGHYYLEVTGSGPMLVSIATGAGVLLLLVVICLAIVCRRRKPLSRAVTLSPPVPRPDLADHAALLQHPDRLALIAFADGVQVGQSILPTYEEAVRERGPGLGSNRFQRPHWPSLAIRRTRNSPNPDMVHVGRQGSFVSHTASIRSGSDPMGSTDTMVVSDVSTTITLDTASSYSGSQPASCRAHCGSLASFDTSSVLNTEGVPLLEESELEEIQGSDAVSLAVENHSITDSSSLKLPRTSPELA